MNVVIGQQARDHIVEKHRTVAGQRRDHQNTRHRASTETGKRLQRTKWPAFAETHLSRGLSAQLGVNFNRDERSESCNKRANQNRKVLAVAFPLP
jgi:hypothetical protein